MTLKIDKFNPEQLLGSGVPHSEREAECLDILNSNPEFGKVVTLKEDESDRIVGFIGGVFDDQRIVSEVFIIKNEDLFKRNKKAFIRTVKLLISEILEIIPLCVLVVTEDFEKNKKWAELLGFEYKGTKDGHFQIEGRCDMYFQSLGGINGTSNSSVSR